MPAMSKPSLDQEQQRARERRKALGIVRPVGEPQGPSDDGSSDSGQDDDASWALCLSGGGIRSATFCLGVLQGLSQTPVSHTAETGPPESAMQGEPSRRLLAQFDFLSTVSGGGFIGAFFSSLFVRGRLSGTVGETDQVAADRAYRVLDEEPPGRMRTRMRYEASRPGFTALAWLRDNGRYLTPGGGGDLAYAAAIATRNGVALLGVIAIALLAVLAGALSFHLVARVAVQSLHWDVVFDPWVLGTSMKGLVPWSATWAAVAGVLCLAAVPFGLAYWCAHPAPGDSLEGPSRPFTDVWICGMALGAAGLGAWWWVHTSGAAMPPWAWCLGGAGTSLVWSGVLYTLTHWLRHPTNVAAQRVLLSRGLMHSLMLATVLAVLAVVETLSLTTLSFLRDTRDLAAAGLTTGAGSSVLVWLVRVVAGRTSGATGSQRPKVSVSMDVLALAAAVVLWLLWAIVLNVLLLLVCLDPLTPPPWNPSESAHMPNPAHLAWVAAAAAVLWGGLSALVGLFPGFINLSTYQPLYSARLTRAYLGASNHQRFCSSEIKGRNVAAPVQGDGVSLQELYANPLAPTHFINVCLNQTAGPEGQLVQRDRKGKPLVVAPGGFYLDGDGHAIQEAGGDLGATLSVGEWIGVSGAAFSTGLGRRTSLGLSLLMGFANVRLGRWWAHGIVPKAGGYKLPKGRQIFQSQSYLLDEMTAKFHGARMPYAYLSDGGHFENTAAYEMLRPGRHVKLLVVCDCGADPDYVFDDLANLTCLARIDHQIELRVNTQVLTHPLLKSVFTEPEAFRRPADGRSPNAGTPCAVLLDAWHHDLEKKTSKQVAKIIVIKPVVVSGIPVDVSYYAAQNPTFPQETTADQFFDEAQWESYRKLGLELTRRIFPQGNDPAYASAFWAHLL